MKSLRKTHHICRTWLMLNRTWKMPIFFTEKIHDSSPPGKVELIHFSWAPLSPPPYNNKTTVLYGSVPRHQTLSGQKCFHCSRQRQVIHTSPSCFVWPVSPSLLGLFTRGELGEDCRQGFKTGCVYSVQSLWRMTGLAHKLIHFLLYCMSFIDHFHPQY